MKNTFPPQQQKPPGIQSEMDPLPQSYSTEHIGTGRLKDQVALISGGDSGIGRAVAISFAKEGAHIAISYLNEHMDAEETKRLVEQEGVTCLLLPGDISDEKVCQNIVEQTINHLGQIDILVNNAAEQHPTTDFLKITQDQLERTFKTNIFSYFYMTKAALPYLKKGARIINTTSVTAYRGSAHLIDYSSTKGAIVSFTRSLSQLLAEKKIRVNGVAPGPVWTPLIVSTFSKEEVKTFGTDVPMKRAGQPEEIAPCYLFLATSNSTYMTGQILHPNGGEIING